jgi:hypothetical protein
MATLTETFDGGQPTLPFSGTWITTTTSPYSGTHCYTNNDIGANETATTTLKIKFITDGSISFWVRTSTEYTYDKLRFYIDGVQQGSYSGPNGWQQVSFNVTAGYHILQWKYSKDGSGDSGEDAVFIDEIVIVGDVIMYKDITPVMTGSSTPSPYVVSASGFTAPNDPWKAFDGSLLTRWQANDNTGNITLDFGTSKTIKNYSVTPFDAANGGRPTALNLEGSNDNSTWTTLDNKSGLTMTDGANDYLIDNATAYRYYRLTASKLENSLYVEMKEINYYENYETETAPVETSNPKRYAYALFI